MTTVNTTAGSADSMLRHSVLSLFVAGAIAVLVFHQGAWTILHFLGLAGPPFPFAATKPLGIPVVWSLVFWGGVWGIIFGLVEKHFPGGAMYWVVALVFGAIFPTLVAWFVAAPLKGQPMAAGWEPTRMMFGLIVNGAWGLGTALLLRWRA